MRHLMASLMLKNGANPKVVQERLGHSSIRQTMDRYSHISINLQREQSEKLAKLIESGK